MNLRCVEDKRQEVRRQERLIEHLRGLRVLTARPLDGLPKSKSQASHVEKIVAQIVDGEKNLSDLRDELLELQDALTAEIYRRVTNLSAVEVLFRRYVMCEKFSAISSTLCISERLVYKLHQQGVDDFNAADDRQKLTINQKDSTRRLTRQI